LEEVAQRALLTVRDQFEFAKCVQRYRTILSMLD